MFGTSQSGSLPSTKYCRKRSVTSPKCASCPVWYFCGTATFHSFSIFSNSIPGNLQLYYNHGYGLREELSSGLIALQTVTEETRILLPIVPFGGIDNLAGIRIDPPDGTMFTLIDLKIIFEYIPEIYEIIETARKIL